MSTSALYHRLGGYDAISALVDALMALIKDDAELRRFYDHRGTDGIAREQQLLVDFLCQSTGGPTVYTGRNLRSSHVGMQLSEDDWDRAMNHLSNTLDAFEVPELEKVDVMSFHENLKQEIIDV